MSNILYNFKSKNICLGKVEAEYASLVPENKGISFRGSNSIDAFKTKMFSKGKWYNLFINSMFFEMFLLCNGKRCPACQKVVKHLL